MILPTFPHPPVSAFTCPALHLSPCPLIFLSHSLSHLLPSSLPLSSQGAIVVFDVTDANSFQKAKNWVKELKRMLTTPFSLTIVGNKIDMDKNRSIHAQEAKE